MTGEHLVPMWPAFLAALLASGPDVSTAALSTQCTEKFDADGLQLISGAMWRTREERQDPSGAARDADMCRERGASYFRFVPGLRELSRLPESAHESREMGQLRGIVSLLGEEQFSELEAFGVCAPPAPWCHRSEWLELGWYLP